MSTTNKLARDQIPIKRLFEQEFYIYNQLVPQFREFQKEMGIKNDLLDFLTTCYLTERFENCEILVLENLKAQGFYNWNRKKCMTEDHIRLVLDALGKWHAFSLALKLKRPKIFEEVIKSKVHTNPYFFTKTGLIGVIYQTYEEAKNFWENDPELDELKFSEMDFKHIYSQLFSVDVEHQVMIHGDSWNNNFMFKSKGGQPVKVCILDWQCASLASPVVDLSHFIYSCIDTEKYTDVTRFLKIYYSSLSQNLEKFDCNPSEVFSFDKLQEHWRQFSKYGLFLGSFIMKFSLCEDDEVPDLIGMAGRGKEYFDGFSFKIKNEKEYLVRVKNNMLHYEKNLK